MVASVSDERHEWIDLAVDVRMTPAIEPIYRRAVMRLPEAELHPALSSEVAGGLVRAGDHVLLPGRSEPEPGDEGGYAADEIRLDADREHADIAGDDWRTGLTAQGLLVLRTLLVPAAELDVAHPIQALMSLQTSRD